MKVAKWDDSLVIQIPSSIVEELDLKEGDDVDVRIGDDRALEIERDSRRKAIEKLKSFKVKLPDDWKFDRDEANSR